MVVFMVMLVGMPMILKGPDGKPIMTFSDWLPSADIFKQPFEQVEAVVNKAADTLPLEIDEENPPPVLSAGSGKMYKWQDDKGRWHFSSEKPVDNSKAAIEDLPNLSNVMEPAVVSNNNSSTIEAPSRRPALPAGPLSISMDQAGELLKQVEQISNDAEERKAAMDSL